MNMNNDKIIKVKVLIIMVEKYKLLILLLIYQDHCVKY